MIWVWLSLAFIAGAISLLAIAAVFSPKKAAVPAALIEPTAPVSAELNCLGCNYAKPGESTPGFPEAAQACYFCVRNKDRENWQGWALRANGDRLLSWGNGAPAVSYPMDAYHSVDMAKQYAQELDWDRGYFNERITRLSNALRIAKATGYRRYF
jgi:hypothetical protein